MHVHNRQDCESLVLPPPPPPPPPLTPRPLSPPTEVPQPLLYPAQSCRERIPFHEVDRDRLRALCTRDTDMCPTNRFSAWSARRREMSDKTACQVTRNTRLWLTAGKTGFRRIDRRTDKTNKTRRVHGCGHTGNSENIFMREYLSGFILLKAINTTTTMMKCVCA